MIAFVVPRALQLGLTFLAGTFLVFVATEAAPGNVAQRILGPYAVPSQVAIVHERLGLGDPLPLRYGRWLATLAGLADNPLADPAVGLGLEDPRGPRYVGNFGFSLMQRQPVVDVLASRIGPTVQLTLAAIALIVPVSLLLGVAAGLRAGSAADRTVTAATLILTSLPEFVTAVLLVLVFSAWLGVLPGVSALDPGDRWSTAAQLVLPTAVLVIASASYVARIVRASVVDTMSRPFVRAAELRGLSPGAVVVRHVLPNALIAPVTVILLQINWILTGVVVVEAIFAYPGLGALLLQAALFGDLHLVQALTLIALAVAIATQLLGDLAYRALDPRLRQR